MPGPALYVCMGHYPALFPGDRNASFSLETMLLIRKERSICGTWQPLLSLWSPWYTAGAPLCLSDDPRGGVRQHGGRVLVRGRAVGDTEPQVPLGGALVHAGRLQGCAEGTPLAAPVAYQKCLAVPGHAENVPPGRTCSIPSKVMWKVRPGRTGGIPAGARLARPVKAPVLRQCRVSALPLHARHGSWWCTACIPDLVVCCMCPVHSGVVVAGGAAGYAPGRPGVSVKAGGAVLGQRPPGAPRVRRHRGGSRGRKGRPGRAPRPRRL